MKPNTTWLVAKHSSLCLIRSMGGLAERVEAKVNASAGPCTLSMSADTSPATWLLSKTCSVPVTL